MAGNSDDTVVVRSRSRFRVVLALVPVLVGAALWSHFWFASPPVSFAALPLLTETGILERAPVTTEAYRFDLQPEIVVLHFVSLKDQAATFNRAAALLERTGYPHDRLLDDAEMDRRIRASGEKPEELYYGHDYRGADLVRFFVLADRENTTLTADEERLRRMMQIWGWRDDTNGALISLVRESAPAGLDAVARATILRHELSHGLYFVDAGYARLARSFWDEMLTASERDRVRLFLAGEGYDTMIDDLVVNEAQAYLVHTPMGRFFAPELVGISPSRIDQLRSMFAERMRPGWLRDRIGLVESQKPPSAVVR